jgi:hypothetical protein
MAYDAKNRVKYLPDGSLDKSPEGVPLAGRAVGCIQCHSAAPGGDMLYSIAPHGPETSAKPAREIRRRR